MIFYIFQDVKLFLKYPKTFHHEAKILLQNSKCLTSENVKIVSIVRNVKNVNYCFECRNCENFEEYSECENCEESREYENFEK